MKKSKQWVYRCDFCGKATRSAGYMSAHEKSCTLNPNRVCRMCRDYGDGTPQAKMGDMLETLKLAKIEEVEEDRFGVIEKIENEKEAIEKLREVANNCPMCILSAIRQTTKYPMLFGSFNFKREKEDFWSYYEEAQIMRGGGGDGY